MKKNIGLLFVLASFKVFSQDNSKTNIVSLTKDSLKTSKVIASNYAIVELKKMEQGDPETATIYFDNGQTEDMTGKLYKNTEADINLIPQRSLIFIRYMAARHYYLISSSATLGDFANVFAGTRHYQYQYFFEKRDK